METHHSQSLGDLLRRYRMAGGLTQEELAERAGLSARGISDLERGVKVRPRKDTIALLAAALGLAPEERARFEVARQRGAGTGPPRAGFAGDALASPHAAALPPFVGRTQELTRLERHLTGEGPPLVLLAGEPGIGKSRLLHEAAARAVGQGWRVLAGGCQRRGGQEPYAPLLDALKSHHQRRSSAELRADLRGCAWLVRLLPELASGPIEPLPGWTLPPEQERRLMFAAAGCYLANVAGPAGTLLLLDDLQWAGPDALDLLATLVRQASTPALRVIGAYRDTEVQPGDALSVAVADLAQAGLAGQCPLGPLAPEEVNRLLDVLLARDASPEVRAHVAGRTGGVPFFVLSCAQALCLRAGEGGDGDVVPWGVAQGIRQRVAALGADTGTVLGVAAVLGREIEPELLGAVVEQPEQAVLAALEAASRARLLVDDGRTYQFAHDLIREVVEADVGAVRRRALHRRAAQALEEVTGEPALERLAYHAGQGGEQEKAARYLEQAGDAAAGRAAHGAAAESYTEAIERLQGLVQSGQAARVREKLGAVLLTAARYDDVVAALEPAAATYLLAGDREGEGRVTAQIGMAYARRGTPPEGLARLRPVLERLDAPEPTPGLARLYLALAYLYHFNEQDAMALAAAERAAALASALGHDVLRGEAAAARGVALDYLGRVEEALPVLHGAIALTEATGQAFGLCDALNMTAHLYDLLGEFARARPYVDRALAVAERAGDQEWIAFLHFHLGFIAFYTGDWPQARWSGERAVMLLGHIGTAWSAGYGTLILGLVSYGEGDWAEAASYLERAIQLQERTPHREAIRIAQSVLAEVSVLQGRSGDARDRLLPLLAGTPMERRDRAFLLPTLAWAQLELGEVAVAARVAADAVDYARAMSDRINLAEALRVQALVSMRQDHWAGAACSLDEGLSLARAMSYPWGEARVLDTYGQMHLRRGESPQARARLEETLTIFRRLGARKDSERTEVALRGLR
ncbi:MAG TPA: AAA family ATPase [Chloroflexota bacterium]|nr:AAA family ATPase [Chloroflexota bacterium]